MTGLEWMSVEDACSLLRVSEDNAGVIQQHAESIPYYIELETDYPSEPIIDGTCHEIVKQLARFILCQWFNPDGSDADELAAVVRSLTSSVKALAVYYGLGRE